MQLKLPKTLLDWVMQTKGDVSTQSFIISQLFQIKQTTNQNEGVNNDTERKESLQTRT